MKTDELTTTDRLLLAREVAADKYDTIWPHRTTYGNLPRDSFQAGWDAALEYVRSQPVDAEDLKLRQRIQDGMDGRG